MTKIRTQLMIDYDIYQRLIVLQGQFGVRSLSLLVNKILKEAFYYKKELETKNKQIDNLQNIITELGERAEGYRAKIISEAGVIDDVKTK